MSTQKTSIDIGAKWAEHESKVKGLHQTEDIIMILNTLDQKNK